MDLGLTGKRVAVTGSAAGMGFVLASAFGRVGARVVLTSRSGGKLERALQAFPGEARGFQGDLAQSNTTGPFRDFLRAEFGGIDILVTNIGSGASVPPGQETEEEWRRVLEINFYSAVHAVAATTGLFPESGGSIVCISSICGWETLAGAPNTYSVAKAALHAFVKGQARPLALRKIRINAVAPGNILHENSVWNRKLAEDPVALARMLAVQVPLGRLGTPEEIANFVLFLASERASFCTGSILVVDGGQVHS